MFPYEVEELLACIDDDSARRLGSVVVDDVLEKTRVHGRLRRLGLRLLTVRRRLVARLVSVAVAAAEQELDEPAAQILLRGG